MQGGITFVIITGERTEYLCQESAFWSPWKI